MSTALPARRRRFPFWASAIVVFGAFAALPARAAVELAIDPAAGRTPISPYIYGTNDDLPGVKFNLRRQGGNRMTGYNWETNASNAGNDYFHQSDDYLTWIFGVTGAPGNAPGLVVTHFQDNALAAGTRYTIATLPMAGYVAADKTGVVSANQTAPSSRWVAVENTKPSAFTATPDLTDGKVYTDELLNFLVTRYGPASSAQGIKAYDLDNEPDLWSNTHPRIHPTTPLCTELIARSVDTAKTVKRIDASAETLGFASYGFGGYSTFQSAPDWTAEKAKGNYRWFVDYFLDRMRQASTTAGQRLLDVLDLHNYTEATGGGVRVNDTSDYTNTAANQARMQSPRSFWDPTYTENSWIGQYNRSFLPWLPNVKQSIDTFYPGTKLGFTEYAFGGEGHISGGIAQADILGIFGKYGVYLAALWPYGNDHTFTAAAFKLYLDYDGAGHQFGDTSVAATAADVAVCSAYASVDSANAALLHVIVLNKSDSAPTTFDLHVAGATVYPRARVFAFDAASAAITERTGVSDIAGNRFSYTLPPLTAAHFVLDATLAPSIAVQPASSRALTTGRSLKLSVTASGTGFTYQWRKNGVNLANATSSSLLIDAVTLADAGTYDCVVTNSAGSVTSAASDVAVAAAVVTQQPASQAVGAGAAATFTATANGTATFQWQRNGSDLANATTATLSLANTQPATTGLYAAVVTAGSTTTTSDWALLGVTTAGKVVGSAEEIASNLFVASNGNTFDQVLLEGAAATITADSTLNQITRMSYLDLNDDIVQVEFGGPGTLSLVLDNSSGPALPAKYNQTISYMKGHANIVITGATAATNVSVFSVGRITAVNQGLFKDGVTYDGIADLAYIAIASTDGKFGGVRTANAHYFASKGPTGLYAPGVEFTGPVYLGNVTAYDTATPVILLGAADGATRITGGDLLQDNGRVVQVSGITQLTFTAGSDSHGNTLTTKSNRAVLMEDGGNITAQIVVNPIP